MPTKSAWDQPLFQHYFNDVRKTAPGVYHAVCRLCPAGAKVSWSNCQDAQRHVINTHLSPASNEKKIASPLRQMLGQTRIVHTKESVAAAVSKFVAEDGKPFMLTEHPAFIELIQSLTGFNPPNRKQVKQQLQRVYLTALQKMRSVVDTLSHYYLAVDGWSNKNRVRVYSVVLIPPSYIMARGCSPLREKRSNRKDDNIQPIYLSSFLPRGETASASWIADKLDSVISVLGRDKFAGVISDSASAMVNMRAYISETYDVPEVGCTAHRLNLLYASLFDAVPWISQLQERLSKAVGKVRASEKVYERYVELCNGAASSLAPPAATRWSYTSLWFRKLLTQRESLVRAAKEFDEVWIHMKVVDTPLTWARLETALQLLEPLDNMVLWCQRDGAKLSSVLRQWAGCKLLMREQLVRFDEEQRSAAEAVLCGPREHALLTPTVMMAAQLDIEELDYKHSADSAAAIFEELSSLETAYASDSIMRDAGYAELHTMATLLKLETGIFSATSTTVQMLRISGDNATFWETLCKLPDFEPSMRAQLVAARNLTSAPASAAAIERLFSKLSLLHDIRRLRMSFETWHMQLFCSANKLLTQAVLHAPWQETEPELLASIDEAMEEVFLLRHR